MRTCPGAENISAKAVKTPESHLKHTGGHGEKSLPPTLPSPPAFQQGARHNGIPGRSIFQASSHTHTHTHTRKVCTEPRGSYVFSTPSFGSSSLLSLCRTGTTCLSTLPVTLLETVDCLIQCHTYVGSWSILRVESALAGCMNGDLWDFTLCQAVSRSPTGVVLPPSLSG